MKNYSATKSKYVATLSKEQKAKFAFVPGEAQNRCTDKGLWQGRTTDFTSPKGGGQ